MNKNYYLKKYLKEFFFDFKVAVEELYQNFFVNGPDLTMRRKANERREEEKTDGHLDRNYNVCFKTCYRFFVSYFLI